MTVNDAISILNGSVRTNLTGVQRFMLMARVQRAAKLGDTEAQRYVTLCELNSTTATKH